MKEKSKQSMRLKDKSFEVESKVQEAVAKAQTAVYETKDLMAGLLADDRRKMHLYYLNVKKRIQRCAISGFQIKTNILICILQLKLIVPKLTLRGLKQKL